ncbi:unnamed protein product, partial [marine sediment metagenome]
FRDTPEFKAYDYYPIKLEYVTTLDSRTLRPFYENHDVKYVVFTKPWLADYWKDRLKRYGR